MLIGIFRNESYIADKLINKFDFVPELRVVLVWRERLDFPEMTQ